MKFSIEEIKEIMEIYSGFPIEKLTGKEVIDFRQPQKYDIYLADYGSYCTWKRETEHPDKRLILGKAEPKYRYVTDGIPKVVKKGDLLARRPTDEGGSVYADRFEAADVDFRKSDLRLIFTREEVED